MENIGKSEKNVKNVIFVILDFILAFLIILNSNSVYKFITIFQSYFNKVSFILLFVIFIAAFFIRKAFLFKKNFLRGLFITLALFIYLLVFGFLNSSGFSATLNLILPFTILAAYIFLCNDKDKIPHVFFAFEQLIVIISALSVVCWIVFSLFRLVPNTGVVESTWGASDQPISIASFFGIYFETQYQEIFGHVIMRNTAIFTEAPMFAWNLLIAFLIELFIKEKIRVVNIVILAIAILSTISTMGYIIALAAALVKVTICFLQSHSYKKLSKKVKIISLFIVIAAVGIACVICYFLFIKKISSDSGSDRMYDYVYGFLAWMDHPILGAGFGNRSSIVAHRIFSADTGFSNGIMDVAAQGGLYLLIWFIGPYVFGFIHAVRKKNLYIACFAVFTFLLAAINCSEYTYLAFLLQLFMLRGLIQSPQNIKKI